MAPVAYFRLRAAGNCNRMEARSLSLNGFLSRHCFRRAMSGRGHLSQSKPATGSVRLKGKPISRRSAT